MKHLTDTPVEWAALREVPVVPGFRRSLPARFPGDLGFYDRFRVRRLHATILVPKTITAFCAAKPIPIRELARRRIRDGAFAFATGRGFDLYRIERHRLAGCSAVARVPPGYRTITTDPGRSRRLGAAALRRVRRLARVMSVVVAILAAGAGVIPGFVHPPESAAHAPQAAQAFPRPSAPLDARAMLHYADDLLSRLYAIDPALALRHLTVSQGTVRLLVTSNRTIREAIPLTRAVAHRAERTRLIPREGGVLLEIEATNVDNRRAPPGDASRDHVIPVFAPSERGDPASSVGYATLTGHGRTDRECHETWRLSPSAVAGLHALLLQQHNLLSLSMEVSDDRYWRAEVVRGTPCSALPLPASVPDAGLSNATDTVTALPSVVAGTPATPTGPTGRGEDLQGFLLDGRGRLFAWRRTRGYLDLEQIR